MRNTKFRKKIHDESAKQAYLNFHDGLLKSVPFGEF